MNFEAPTPESSPDQKKTEYAQLRHAVAAMISETQGSDKEKIKVLIQALIKHDTDYGLTDDKKALDNLITEIGGYDGSEPLVDNATKKIQALREDEGRYSDPQSFFSRLAIIHMNRLGWKTFKDNPVFGYETEGNSAIIHLFNPFKNTELDGPGSQVLVLRKFSAGLNEFLKVVEADPSIQKVIASSPLLADQKFQAFMEKFGFDVNGPIDEEKRQKYFSREQREVVEAVATRDSLARSKADKA